MDQFKDIDQFGSHRAHQHLERNVDAVLSNGASSYTINFTASALITIDVSNAASLITIDVTNATKEVQCYKVIVVNDTGLIDRTIAFNPSISFNLVNISVKASQTSVFSITYDGAKFHRADAFVQQYTEDNDYTSNNVISDSDSYKTALSKLDVLIEKIKPLAPFDITTVTPIRDETQFIDGLLKSSDHTIVNDVTFQPSIILNCDMFKDEEAGQLELKVNNANLATKTLTENDDTDLSNANLKVVSNERVNSLYRTLNVQMIISKSDAGGASANQKSVKLSTTSPVKNSNSMNFYWDEIVSNIAPSTHATPLTAITSALNRVSGLPVLTQANTVEVHTLINSCITNFRRATIAEIRSASFSQIYYVTPGAVNYAANAQVEAAVTCAIKAGIYESNLAYYVKGVKPDGSYTPEAGPLNYNISSRMIMVDSITDVTKFGYNHVNALTQAGNTQLMILGGIVQYPRGNYTNYEIGNGIDATLTYDSISNARYLELTLAIVNKGSVDLNFQDQLGFTNTAIETNSGYQLQMKLDSGAWLDANSAYKGFGIVGSGEGCLDIANSTMSKKSLTFGNIVSGTVTVRLTLTNASSHKFNQTISLTASTF